MKKRYAMTLTKEHMEGLQEVLRSMGLKPESGIISDMVDEYLGELLRIGLPAVKAGRKPTTLDYFRDMIDQIDKLQEHIEK